MVWLTGSFSRSLTRLRLSYWPGLYSSESLTKAEGCKYYQGGALTWLWAGGRGVLAGLTASSLSVVLTRILVDVLMNYCETTEMGVRTSFVHG